MENCCVVCIKLHNKTRAITSRQSEKCCAVFYSALSASIIGLRSSWRSQWRCVVIEPTATPRCACFNHLPLPSLCRPGKSESRRHKSRDNGDLGLLQRTVSGHVKCLAVWRHYIDCIRLQAVTSTPRDRVTLQPSVNSTLLHSTWLHQQTLLPVTRQSSTYSAHSACSQRCRWRDCGQTWPSHFK